jgi:hypothetical protein
MIDTTATKKFRFVCKSKEYGETIYTGYIIGFDNTHIRIATIKNEEITLPIVDIIKQVWVKQ